VQKSMRASLEGMVSSQRDMERIFRDWSMRSGWGAMGVTPASTAAAAEPKRDGAAAAGTDEADKLREEVSALRDRLRSLEDRLQKRKAESK